MHTAAQLAQEALPRAQQVALGGVHAQQRAAGLAVLPGGEGLQPRHHAGDRRGHRQIPLAREDLLPLGAELALPLLQAEQELLPLQRAARKLRLEHLPLHVDAVGLFVAGQDFQLVELLAQVLVRLVAVVEAVLPLGGKALELDLDLRKAHVVGPLPKDREHVARLHALAVLHAVLDELRVLGFQVHRDLAHELHGGRGAELLDEGSALHAHGALVGRLLPGGIFRGGRGTVRPDDAPGPL